MYDQSGNSYWLNEVSGVSAWEVPSNDSSAVKPNNPGVVGYSIEL